MVNVTFLAIMIYIISRGVLKNAYFVRAPIAKPSGYYMQTTTSRNWKEFQLGILGAASVVR